MHRITLNLNLNNRMTQKLLLCLSVAIILCFFVAWAQSARAQSPTPEEGTATPPVQVQDEIKEQVQQRIEGIRQAVKKRAFWGTLKEITNSTLVLDSPRGERRVLTDKDTKFFGAGKEQIKFEDLEIDNFIIAMGYLNENGTLTAKRIIALKTPPKPAIKRHAVYGKVSDIDEDDKILTLSHLKTETTFKVQVVSSTIITKKVEGEMKKVVFGAIEIGDRIVAIGTREKEGGILTAKIIHVIPGKAEGLEKITPTPTVSPTPAETEEE